MSDKPIITPETKQPPLLTGPAPKALPQPTPPPTPASNQKRNRVILIAITIFLVLGLAWFAYWLLWGRLHKYTNDAYVNGNMVFLTPQVNGIVTSYSAMDTDFVTEGRILVELDPTDAKIALDLAKAELGNQVRQVVQMFEAVDEYYADMEKKEAVLIQTAQDYEHRECLIDSGAISTEDLEHATAFLTEALADLISSEHKYAAALAQVENTTVETHPLVMAAKEKVAEAYVNLMRCTILSPVTGIVAQRNVQVGKQVKKAEPLLAIIPLDQMWVDANYKEVQLPKVRIGQPAKVTSDLWGHSVVFHGKVVGIAGGTGSVFSLLPPQNATGNWIKIVQRLPVKILLDPNEIRDHPLRRGLDGSHDRCLRWSGGACLKVSPIVPSIKPM